MKVIFYRYARLVVIMAVLQSCRVADNSQSSAASDPPEVERTKGNSTTHGPSCSDAASQADALRDRIDAALPPRVEISEAEISIRRGGDEDGTARYSTELSFSGDDTEIEDLTISVMSRGPRTAPYASDVLLADVIAASRQLRAPGNAIISMPGSVIHDGIANANTLGIISRALAGGAVLGEFVRGTPLFEALTTTSGTNGSATLNFVNAANALDPFYRYAIASVLIERGPGYRLTFRITSTPLGTSDCAETGRHPDPPSGSGPTGDCSQLPGIFICTRSGWNS